MEKTEKKHTCLWKNLKARSIIGCFKNWKKSDILGKYKSFFHSIFLLEKLVFWYHDLENYNKYSGSMLLQIRKIMLYQDNFKYFCSNVLFTFVVWKKINWPFFGHILICILIIVIYWFNSQLYLHLGSCVTICVILNLIFLIKLR